MIDPPEPCLVECEDCDGTGAVLNDDGDLTRGTECPRCEGCGQRYFDEDDAAHLVDTWARYDALHALGDR